MGNIATKVTKKALRPFKNFAVQERTERILAKEKRESAPWHPSTQKKIDEIMRANPNFPEEQNKKDESLDNRLKELYVTSKEPNLAAGISEKPLPLERKNVIAPEFGYQEPVKVTKGKMSLRQVLVMLSEHQSDPSKHSALSLAHKYTIHPKVSENILKYFRPFDFYQSTKKKTEIGVQDYISLKSLQPSKEPDQPLLGDEKNKR